MAKKTFGYPIDSDIRIRENTDKFIQYINLKLAALGQPIHKSGGDSVFLDIAQPLIKNHKEQSRLLSGHLCPVDQRIQDFLNRYLADVEGAEKCKLPSNTFVLDRHGIARMLSIPAQKDSFHSDIIASYRVQQGVIHNPKNDRRTTKGSFHIAEGGLPIPYDKIAVPKETFAKLFELSLQPPKELLELPFTSDQEEKACAFVSLLLRPIVAPEVPGHIKEKSLETRFIAPGNLVSNLDFVESIFGNAGDPYLPENDAAFDVDGWTGTTGCVILAPHLINVRKKDVGLPHVNDATERQKRDGMCWGQEDELYNDGSAFKLTCRDASGVVVTLIADNYFGYCKKEVKTQIGFSSNLYGLTEEEHAGGALAFPSYDLGEEFHLNSAVPRNNMTFKEMIELYPNIMTLQEEGYAIDREYDSIFYIPEDAVFNLQSKTVKWTHNQKEQTIKLHPSKTYIWPSGYKIEMRKANGSNRWRLIGTIGEGTFCHKPCTVSGGGKSEISKSIQDAMIQGPLFTTSFSDDLDEVEKILQKDFGDRFKAGRPSNLSSRPILSSKRSLGSVIKLFTPSEEYTDEYNGWLKTLPYRIKDIIYTIKRYYNPSMGDDWRQYFSVDRINGTLGHELKYKNNKIIANYLRVGRDEDGSWRIFKLRSDYNAAQKIQTEDDITASVVLPTKQLKHLNPNYKNESVKFSKNCESRLFQRPDDAIIRGYDKQAEKDLSSDGTFFCNYEPLTIADAKELVEDVIEFEKYTEPVKELLLKFVQQGKVDYVVSSAHPRVIDGQPSKNPRYLQNRPDLMDPRSKYIAEVGTRLYRKVPQEEPVFSPVNAVLPGRRMNPADTKNNIPPLAVYNPIHYQELPELFIDFICSVTGKSPSTTGFGSEGALTKGPFNALWPTSDLNNALLSYILTGYQGFSSAAGYIGPKVKVEHDISLLIPEIWCRMNVEERDPQYLIEHGYLDKVQDFDYKGKQVEASLLGYRINIKFVHSFLGRIFNNPNDVFSPEMLRPEIQDFDAFVESMDNLILTQHAVADNYFKDGSIEAACPPLRALLHIMAHGSYEGLDRHHPEFRKLFTRDYVVKSDWYQKRIEKYIVAHVKRLGDFKAYLQKAAACEFRSETIQKLNLEERIQRVDQELEALKADGIQEKLFGTLGVDLETYPSPVLVNA